ncbi:FMN-binding negative transcriptional regulator [Chryseobacterium indoltheticum]|nr:FMN-binding negative transcriptional regulator [Chryseobacterium indoltheticum]
MYIPKAFRFDDRSEIVDFMKRYSFGTIVTNKHNLPIATHLPFHIECSKEKMILSSHFAVANEQAKYIEDSTSLVIFTEPHAYISPSNYEKIESVPTWDYISVHAYGNAKIITDADVKLKELEKVISFYEPSYLKQWDELSNSRAI